MSFEKWFNTLLKEKEIDDYQEIEIEAGENFGYINVKTIKKVLFELPLPMRQQIKEKFIRVDFENGDTLNFLTYLANGLV